MKHNYLISSRYSYKWLMVFLVIILLHSLKMISQDTFSIVAVDSITGEVGAAGASCLDLFPIIFPAGDDFIAELFPGKGAIASQAYYSPNMQIKARTRMNLGDTPAQIIQWLQNNDVFNEPQFRQYGIVAFVNGKLQTAAHTGASTDDYKNHILGPNYSIQGNILLGQKVLDSMEARFVREKGDLACKLMAALQGAKMIGADSRCAENGTSSLFAFVKTSKPTDTFGNPYFRVSVRTPENSRIEPIDSLQIKFNVVHGCQAISSIADNDEKNSFVIYPNPAGSMLKIKANSQKITDEHTIEIVSISGSVAHKSVLKYENEIDISSLVNGVYFIRIINNHNIYTHKFIKN